jgi:hypothetical protein
MLMENNNPTSEQMLELRIDTMDYDSECSKKGHEGYFKEYCNICLKNKIAEARASAVIEWLESEEVKKLKRAGTFLRQAKDGSIEEYERMVIEYTVLQEQAAKLRERK